MVKCIGINKFGKSCKQEACWGLPNGKADYCVNHCDKLNHIDQNQKEIYKYQVQELYLNKFFTFCLFARLMDK